MSNIQVETQKDRVVNTVPSLRLDMSNIELAPEEPASKPRIEIPERLSRPRIDSDSSDEGKLDAKEFDFAVNKKKFNPAVKEIDAKSGPADTQSQQSKKLPARNDTDSEKSRHSNRSRRSREEKRDSIPDTGGNPEYRPRYATGSSLRFNQAPPVTTFLNSDMVSSRKSYETMSSDDIRREKNYFLQQYLEKNKNHIYSTKKLSMDNTLDEIRNELEFITRKRERANSLAMWKRGLIFFVEGVARFNDYVGDPFDIDLTDWAKDTEWDINRAGAYDEVLEELAENWRGKMPMAPEYKLIFLMGTSLANGVMKKKSEKAQMAKRIEDEKRMEARIMNRIRSEMAQQAHANQMQHTMQPGISIPDPRQHNRRYQGVLHVPHAPHVPPHAPLHVGNMSGPSFAADAAIIRELKANFMDSTIAGDITSASSDGRSRGTRGSRGSQASRGSRGSGAGSTSQKAEETPTKRGRGRPKKSTLEESVADKGDDETTQEKVISIPTSATPAGVFPRRGRGRPRKNTMENPQNAVVLEL